MRKPLVLIVDDEAGMCEILRLVFEANGFAVETARSGEEAWELIRGQAVDVVLSDIVMPGMSGLQLFRRSRESGCRYPFFFTTGYRRTYEEEFQQAMKEGLVAVFAKPFRNADVVRSVRAAIGQTD